MICKIYNHLYSIQPKPKDGRGNSRKLCCARARSCHPDQYSYRMFPINNGLGNLQPANNRITAKA